MVEHWKVLWNKEKVQVHDSLKVVSQMNWVVTKAFNTLAFIGKHSEYKSWVITRAVCLSEITLFNLFVQFGHPAAVKM